MIPYFFSTCFELHNSNNNSIININNCNHSQYKNKFLVFINVFKEHVRDSSKQFLPPNLY